MPVDLKTRAMPPKSGKRWAKASRAASAASVCSMRWRGTAVASDITFARWVSVMRAILYERAATPCLSAEGIRSGARGNAVVKSGRRSHRQSLDVVALDQPADQARLLRFLDEGRQVVGPGLVG